MKTAIRLHILAVCLVITVYMNNPWIFTMFVNLFWPLKHRCEKLTLFHACNLCQKASYWNCKIGFWSVVYGPVTLWFGSDMAYNTQI